MSLIFIAVLLFSLAGPISDGATQIIMLALVQLLLLVYFIRERTLSVLGSFVFMSFLFFGMRPLYIIFENDTEILVGLYRVNTDSHEIGMAIWWATAGLIVFVICGLAARRLAVERLRAPQVRSELPPVLSPRFRRLLLLYQFVSTAFLVVNGGQAYGSVLGAYAYDFPVILHGGQLFAAVVLSEQWIRSRLRFHRGEAGLSIGLFLVYTLLLRNTTLFRGQWITGVLILAVALSFRWQKRFPPLQLVLPVILLLPIFRALGESRNVSTGAVAASAQFVQVSSSPINYWEFFNANGDMNIADGFIAAKQFTPENHPYLLPWLYVPVHWVPRMLWTGKPEAGVLEDMSFTNGAPYSPGLIGFFLLDGGLLWMVGCMAAMGVLLAFAEVWIMTRVTGYMRLCAYAGLVINAMFITRFFLWQSFYQILYFLAPCYFLHRFSRQYIIGQPGGPLPRRRSFAGFRP